MTAVEKWDEWNNRPEEANTLRETIDGLVLAEEAIKQLKGALRTQAIVIDKLYERYGLSDLAFEVLGNYVAGKNKIERIIAYALAHPTKGE